MRGLWNLTWLEIKIFVREPLGLLGSVVHARRGVRRARPPDGRTREHERPRARFPQRGRARPGGHADRAQRRAVARDDHRDLP